MMKKGAWALMVALALCACDGGSGEVPGASASPSPSAWADAQRGFNFACWYEGCFQDEGVAASLDALVATGANAIAIVPTWYQDDVSSSAIEEDPDKSATADDLRSLAPLARDKGLRLLLKPHIDLRSGAWRGEIEPDDLAAWQEDYRAFLLHFAGLAEELGIEVLSIGTELKSRSGDADFWRGLIADVRGVYSGELTYAANWDEYDRVAFWDDLDFIGIDFYFPIAERVDASVSDMMDELNRIAVEETQPFAAAVGRPVLLTEIGFRDVDGTAMHPWEYGTSAASDPQEQADAYRAVLTAFGGADWLEGVYWWRWDPALAGDAEGYTIHGKPAKEVLKEFWASLGGSGGAEPVPDALDASSAVDFVAFGDYGTGDDEQLQVADALAAFCSANECEFVVTLGDNFQGDGISGADDTQWQERFHEPYDRLGIPFYITLGNHDSSGDVASEIAHTAVADNWVLPATEHAFAKPDGAAPPVVEFFIIFSEYGHFGIEERIWLTNALDQSAAAWKILAAHHPIYSNGNHGDGDDWYREALIPLICGRVDLVLSGHSHSFSHLRSAEDGCAIEQLVIGTGGAGPAGVDAGDPRVVTSDGVRGTASMHGFGWFQVTADQLVFRMIDTAGDVFYRFQLER